MIHWPTLMLTAAATLVFLLFAPAPVGCGCARRKARLQELGGEVFGA